MSSMVELRRESPKLADMAQRFLDAGSPTDTDEAERLWHLCSNYHGLPVQTAKLLYLAAGYEPFAGFPLQHKRASR